METFEIVIIIILTALYLIFFCFPGFMFAREAFLVKYDRPGCSEIIWAIVGLPGTIIGLLTRIPKLIKERKREKEQEKRELMAELKEQEEKQEKERAKEQERKKRIIENEKKLQTFRSSPETEKLVNYIKSYSQLPYKIQIFEDRVSFYYENGSGSYDFLTNGLKNLSIRRSFLGTEQDFAATEKQSEGYLLALAINEKFDNAYSVYEDWNYKPCEIDYWIRREMASITMGRQLKGF